MKAIITIFTALLFIGTTTKAQEAFDIHIEALNITNAPNVHSYSWAKTADAKWVIIGGRIDGLHQRQPFAAFLASSNNTTISVIDPINNQVWSTSLNTLSAPISEQLQSTNQQFFQKGNTLYIIGGYGYSATNLDHVTYDKLTAVDIDGLATAIINSSSITGYFRQISDSNLAVTGGQLGYHNNVFYLCGGQYFEGRYNPMGPDHGPGFIQEYSDEIRKFEILDNSTNLSISNYSAVNDTDQLHRRDYNMSPQIFPDGQNGFTMFSGVFNPQDLPYLNTVDITSSGYVPTTNFHQYLSNYHSAKTPIYDQTGNAMHTIFFGGMSQYTMDSSGNLIQDNKVPFVKTISKISRFSDSSLVESKLDIEMPTLLGSGAEFIPVSNPAIFIDQEIVDLNSLTSDSTLIGYLYGGIESSQANIFFTNNGTQSNASNQIFKVFVVKNITGINETKLENKNIFNLTVFPNPSQGKVTVSFFIPSMEKHRISLFDIKGTQIKEVEVNQPIGNYINTFDWSNLPSGEYIITISNGIETTQSKLLVQ